MGRSTISRRERDGRDSLGKAKRQSGTRRGKKRRKRGAWSAASKERQWQSIEANHELGEIAQTGDSRDPEGR